MAGWDAEGVSVRQSQAWQHTYRDLRQKGKAAGVQRLHGFDARPPHRLFWQYRRYSRRAFSGLTGGYEWRLPR